MAHTMFGIRTSQIQFSFIALVFCAHLEAFNSPARASQETFAREVQPFLADYCVKCHGPKVQRGERRFDRLTEQIPDDNTLVDFQDILDQLNLTEMPPEKSQQPTIEERRTVIQWITKRIADYHKSRTSNSKHPVLRRLNSREYRNTVRDLLHLNMTIFDPTAPFPRDQTTHHLDNVGETLVTSGHLLARYLEAAEHVIDRAILPLEKPKVQTWTFRDDFRQQPEIDQVYRKTNKFAHITLLDVPGADKPEGAYAPIHPFKKGVPVTGFYEIEFEATALNRVNPYDSDFLGQNPDELLRLAIVPGNYRVGDLHKTQPIEPILSHFELKDGKQTCRAKIWLDEGYTPRFIFPNGQMDIRNLYARILKEYPELFPNAGINKGIVGNRFAVLTYGKLPQIQIDNIQIKGPIYDKWPTASQNAILGDDWSAAVGGKNLSDQQIRSHLTSFISKAYRRPAEPVEVERVLKLVNARRQTGRSQLMALGDGLKSVLCSPNFLYLQQSDEQSRAEDAATALASRLSYFLWSSTPDDELHRLATSLELFDRKVLSQQVDRMLRDPKSDAFVQGFLDSWLTLRELGATPPARDQFQAFYQYGLDEAMRQETRLFFRHLLDEDLSIVNFLDSDFTFVNNALARHYKIDATLGHSFQKVALTDRRRGGLLGQASVLTVTANGIDTSPVVRGVWLLDNILGSPPSPPPPDVEPLDPDVRGAKTIREQLDKHRNVPSCFDCHRKIDPLGFALENFDPVGGWRNYYDLEARTRIDTAGELPGGKEFNDVIGLKKILIKQKSQFALALSRKLLEYATGRESTAHDRPDLDRILERLESADYGLRTLVREIVLSESFCGIERKSNHK